MSTKIVRSTTEEGSYNLVDLATGAVLLKDESFGVCDNVRDSIVYGCHMQDECGEVAAAILKKLG